MTGYIYEADMYLFEPGKEDIITEIFDFLNTLQKSSDLKDMESYASYVTLLRELTHIYIGDVNGHSVNNWKKDTNYKATKINSNTADYIVAKASSDDLQSCLDLITTIYNTSAQAIINNQYNRKQDGIYNLTLHTGNKNFIVYENKIADENIVNKDVDFNVNFVSFPTTNFLDLTGQQQYSNLYSIL